MILRVAVPELVSCAWPTTAWYRHVEKLVSQNITVPGWTCVTPAATVAVRVSAEPWAKVLAERVSVVVVAVAAHIMDGASANTAKAQRNSRNRARIRW